MDCPDDLEGGQHHAPGLMEQAELVDCPGPDTGDRLGVEARAIRDHLRGLDTHLGQPLEERLHLHAADRPMDQLVAHQPIAVRTGRIDCDQERELVLVDLIDAEDPGEGAYNPGLVVLLQIEFLGV